MLSCTVLHLSLTSNNIIYFQERKISKWNTLMSVVTKLSPLVSLIVLLYVLNIRESIIVLSQDFDNEVNKIHTYVWC
jgi:hypothetical protein